MIKTNRQRLFGVILQYLQMALNILISLAYTPIMLRMLGANEYGIYNLASSTISYLSLLSLGFGSSYIRWYSIYKRNDNKNEISRLNGLYIIVFSIMGFFALMLGIALVMNVSIFFNDSYSSHDLRIAKILMLFLTINLAISFPASVFNSYITSQEEFVFQKIVNMGRTIVSPIMNLTVLFYGYGSVGMIISTTIISIIVDIINIRFCINKLKMRISFSNVNFHLLKDIFVFSIFIAMNQIIDQINWQTDKIILGKLINGSAVAVYAVGGNLNTMFTSFSTAVSGVFEPKVNMIVSKGEKSMDEQLTELFIKIGRLQWFILALILSGFIFFGKFFVIKWAGSEYINSYYVALLLMGPAIIPLIQNIGIEIQRAKNMHQFRSIVYLLMAFTNVGISIILAKRFGEVGAAFGTTISILIANGLIMNIYYKVKIGLDINKFWKSIISTMHGMIPSIIFGILLNKFYSFISLVDYSLFIILYVIIYTLSVYLLSLNKQEKQYVCQFLGKVFHIKRIE